MPEVVLRLHKSSSVAVQPVATDEAVLSIARFVKGDRGDNATAAQQQCFVSNIAPVDYQGPYLWVQTGLGSSGTDFTIWIEDGR